MSSSPRVLAPAYDAPFNSLNAMSMSGAGHLTPHLHKGRSSPLQTDTKPPATPIRKKPRPAERVAQARANHKAGALSREQAAVYLGVGYSTLEKLAARGEGPFCFKVGNLVRYPVDELEAWKLANDARQQTGPGGCR